MKIKSALSAFGIFLIMAPLSHAGYTLPGKVSNVMFMGNGTVIFNLSSNSIGDKPPCAYTYPNSWSIETNTSAGKARLAGLLTAYSTGADIKISGTGDCPYWGDREGVDYFQTVD
jgi:hypothetical protein